jgi:hypothetical protein
LSKPRIAVVGYRRPKQTAELARRWRDFTEQQHRLFDDAGLPGVLREDHRLFDDFLMHGFLADGSGFDAGQLDAVQWSALDELVAAYVSRFYDPGVALGPRPD